jgi:hypothetical protein
MVMEKKVRTRDTPKHTSSSDDESSDVEVDYNDLSKGLDELIDALNEKDRLLEKQEDILYEEHDKFINVQKPLALELKKNELLSSELSTCHDSISSLKNVNADLNVKLEKVNVTSSCLEHVVICNRCKDFDVDACNKHVSTILNLNNDVPSLNAQLKTCKDNYKKLKFARDAYTIGRDPSIKDGLGFQKGTKNLTNQRTSNLNKEKGKDPMASSSQKNHTYLYDKKVTSIAHPDRCHNHAVSPIYHDTAFSSHAMFASSSSYAHGRNRSRRHHIVSNAPRKASSEPTMIYQTCDVSFVLLCKNDKVVARSLGPKCKRDKICIWVPKSIVTNLVGPNKSWVPKTQA